MQRLIKLTENVPEQTFLLCSVDNTCNIHNHSPPPSNPFSRPPSVITIMYCMLIACKKM